MPLFASPTPRDVQPFFGFEKTAGGFRGHGLGAVAEINATGAVLRSREGLARVMLRGSNRAAKVLGEGDAGTQNYLIGSDPAGWRTNIHLFKSVHIQEAYPGIDVVYKENQRRLEYDFIVSPRSNPAKIRLGLRGGKKLRLNADGDLLIDRGAPFHQHPEAYQMIAGERRTVASGFHLNRDGSVGFSLGSYDPSIPLVIDPTVTYASYWGGNDQDEGHGAAVDSNGNLVVVGLTYSTTTSNANVMVRSVPASGSQVQTVLGGTTGNAWANAVTIDSSGNVYVTGRTAAYDFPSIGANFQCNGTVDAFVLSLQSNLQNYNFSTCFGGTGTDEGFAIALAPNSLVYVVGHTNSTDFPIGTSAFQTSNHGGYDGFWAGFTTAGGYTAGTYLGGSSDDHAYALAVDVNGYSYIAGATASPDFLINQTINPPYTGGNDGFVLQLNTNGTLGYYFAFIGGTNDDVVNGIALDSSGNVYMAGTTSSSDFPISTGAYQSSYQGGNSDGFLFVLSISQSKKIWSSYLGSSGDDVINALALDASANIWVTGSTNGSSFPVTGDAPQPALAGGQDAILARVSNDGTSLISSTYFGGNGDDVGTSLALDGKGSIYLTGITASVTGFPFTLLANQKVYGGGTSDGFIATFLSVLTAPVVNANGVVDGASFSTSAISPGGIISIFGTNFALIPQVASTKPLPTSLGNVSVSVNGTAIPLFYVGPIQINAQLPYETAIGTASVTVSGAGGTSSAVSFDVVTAAPGIFLADSRGVIQNQDYSLNTSSNGAKPGSVIIVYFTGTGPLDNAVATGAVAPESPLSSAISKTAATIGGWDSSVNFMGLTPGFAGLAQANLVVPTGLSAGDYPVVLTIDGVASAPATVTISTN